jgi:hypothetical protein
VYRSYVWIRRVCFIFLLACLSAYVGKTWHCPLMGDAALMHYDVFLMRHGMALYRDIIDPNLPTTFAILGAVIHFAGGNSLAWRLFDFSLLMVIGLSMVIVSRPYDRFAGFFAGSLFALVHGRDGFMQLGQRDLIMTAFLLLGYAFLFESLRVKSVKLGYFLIFSFGVFSGIAATIKPTVLLLPPTLLVMSAVVRKRKGCSIKPYVICGSLGTVIPLLSVAIYVWRGHIVRPFLDTLFYLIPYFAHLGSRSFAHLFFHSISSFLLPLVLVWFGIEVVQKRAISWERAALMVGIAFGIVSFCLQRKGYSYHRYPSEAFLLMLISIDLTSILKSCFSRRSPQLERLAITGILIGIVVVGGGSTIHILRQDWQDQEFQEMLEADLYRLGNQSLAGRIQCLDMADGCIPTLDDMRLVQASGFIYDCYMFSTQPGLERERYRRAFWQTITTNPPSVYVISSNNCEEYPTKQSYNYTKTSVWPVFDAYLKANYHLYVERIPPRMVNTGSSPSRPLGYRIYLRNGADIPG